MCAVSVACYHCGAINIRPPSLFKKAKRHYCSRKCQIADRHGAHNPNWKGGNIERTCRGCGKKFIVLHALAKRGEGHYCSQKCKKIFLRIYPTPAIAHRESGRRYETNKRAAKKLRTHTWKEWESLLKKYRYSCARCGSGEDICRDHKIPISKGGDDGIDNIQPLCRQCNSRKWNKI